MRKLKNLSFLFLLPVLIFSSSCSGDKAIAKQPADFSLQSIELYQAFNNNESEANQKYAGKLLEVVGTVSGLKPQTSGGVSLMLETNDDGTVQCNFTEDNRPKFSNIKVGESIKIKGICSGFLLDVMLDHCILINI